MPNEEGTLPVLTVSSQGSVKAIPEIAYLNLAVQTRAANAVDARREAGRLMQDVVAGLREAGVPETDLLSFNSQVMPEQPMSPHRLPVSAGPPQFLASQMLRVTVRDISQANKLLDLAATCGANGNQQPMYAFRDPDAVQLPAYAAAVHRAQQIATVLATAAGLRLGEILSIATDPQIQHMMMHGRPIAADVLDPTRAGEQTVSAGVKVTFRLLPG